MAFKNTKRYDFGTEQRYRTPKLSKQRGGHFEVKRSSQALRSAKSTKISLKTQFELCKQLVASDREPERKNPHN